MDYTYNSYFFNEFYAENGGGNYIQKDKWMSFFSNIADQIVENFNPKTVLDAGCATGYLVEALRDKGVDAYGFDISEYAISNVREDIKPFCIVHSITDPLPESLPKQFDLIISIEVLEHLFPEEGKKAITNLCKYTNAIIFTSTPDDIDDRTHVNVQQKEYWARLFAEHSFYHDLIQPLDYICPWAMLFLRKDNISIVICDYERKIRLLESTLKKQKKQSLDSEFTSILFFDSGDGFNTDNAESVHSQNYSFCFQVPIDSKTTSVRFDPVEEKGCIVQNLEVLSNNGPLTAINLNGIKIDDFDVFTNTDPQFLIDLEGNSSYWIKIKAVIFPFEDMEWFRLLSKFKGLQDKETELVAALKAKETDMIETIKTEEKIQNELDYYKNNYATLIAQREDLTRQLGEVSGAYQCISSSSFWRMTKPLRVSLDIIKKLLKSNRLTLAFYKGVKCFRENGFHYTWVKVTSNLFNQAHMNEFNKSQILSKEEIEKQKNTIFYKGIKFSIIVPLYNTPENYLIELIGSVISQTYGNWELCLADGSDNENNIKKIITQYNKKYKNIKYTKISKNLGISGNTIEAYKLATGNYFILLDHDDFLTQNALYELSNCLEEDSTVDFIYSDRAIFLDGTKKVLAYHFLPGYSPDFLRACNYASHLNAFSKYIIDEVGFIRSGYDGSQDYDLELRVIEKARKIINIPKVLYYCRACEGSVALNPESKIYAYEAGRKAIEKHIQRIGYPGKVEFLHDTFSYRIHYDIKKDEIISIIIPNKDHIDELKRCINSILEKTDYENYEIVIVENNSIKKETFDYYSILEKNKKIKVIYYEKKDFNYSEINNYAVDLITTPYILFLNNDTEVINSNWLTEMLMFAQREDVGAVGAKLYYPNETFQHVGLYIGLGGHIASHYDHGKSRYETGYMHRLSMPQNYNALTAACLLMKRTDFIKVDGFDNVNFKIGLNDIDLCLKLRELGKINVLTPYAELYHYESISRGLDTSGKSKNRFEHECKIFRAKWNTYFTNGDEYLNLNFI